MDVSRHGQFKKSGSMEAGRKGRHESAVAIRKQNKERNIKALRELNSGGANAGTVSSASGQTEGLSERMKERLAKLPEWVAGINSNDIKKVHESTEAIRKMLSIERKPPIEEVISMGIVPRLIQFIDQDQSHELQFEAAWALTNIASGTTHHTKVVIEGGAVPIFVRLLRSPNADVREQAIWALGNIAGDMVAYRNMVLECGAMDLLLEQLKNPENKLSVVRNGTWTLSNFCRGKPAPPLEVVQPALQLLAELIKMSDEDVIVDACWALSYISDGTQEKIAAIIGSGVCPRLVELLTHKSESVQTPALRAVGNIVTGSDIQTQVVINLGVLRCLLQLLGARKESIVKEACWTISNITAGSNQQIQAAIEAGVFGPLVHLLANSTNFEVKKEAAWAISNATSLGLPVQIQYLVEQGVIKPFCDLLDEQDTNLVIVALDCLENILKVGKMVAQSTGGDNLYANMIDEYNAVEKIENLTVNQNPEIHSKSCKIIELYFDEEDETWNAGADGQNNLGPNPGFGGAPQPNAGSQFQFNFN